MLSSTMEQFVMQELGLNETVWVDAGGTACRTHCKKSVPFLSLFGNIDHLRGEVVSGSP